MDETSTARRSIDEHPIVQSAIRRALAPRIEAYEEEVRRLVDATYRVIERTASVDPTVREILAEPLRYAEFQVHLPAGPGLVVALDEDKIAHYTRGRVAPVSIPVKAV